MRHCDHETPPPAGSRLTRRSLLLGGAGLALTVFGGRLLAPQAFAEGIAGAAQAAPGAPVIVSVFLSGGVDGIALLPPVADPRYTPALRPSLWVDPASTLPLQGSSALRWHPAAGAFKQLHDSGRLTLFPAIGYEHANGSHFTSRHFYEVGATDPDGATGWLGRWLDRVGEDHNPVQGFTVGPTLSPALATGRVAVAAAEAPSAYTFETPGVFGGGWQQELLRGHERLGQLTSADPVLGPARERHRDAADLRRTLATPLQSGAVAYPDNRLGDRLRDTARLLGAGLPIRAAALDAHADFDTHAGQDGVFGEQVAGCGAALAAFQADLEARGLGDRVLTLVWSEFGRRPEENGSGGTDHGAGGVAFLIGTRVRGGLVGEFRGLGALDEEGNLLPSSDFRALYASVLEQWLGHDAAAVIPGADGFARYALLR
ncbi:DUF1501 domain-containing protein [Conexibacter sp. JD483]|uniref:DUF1501 domain-containing protein n=1 Tax=unclassified Conexibacter TaxID=2627773 RepID=UPI0027169221|nr:MULTISPECIES: DUF1501 domain-containing protein [unclassified Conexibacter]MDO8186279.1 DUF1501 domain-containing protein [Conexibacter sp. CPCC 205706]MDO8197484.1 DUF1501 domain-containing protein [Conexibacter sp. CPCC 205762]MDR9370267.1 DUF1501 domain-containing protein [Conexibacter sp. JD483]